jgi:hypothetical protein
MRSNVDPQKIEQLMKALGREARGSGCIYFTGGASALLIGWRSSTVDIDIRLDPEPPGIFQAIAKLFPSYLEDITATLMMFERCMSRNYLV